MTYNKIFSATTGYPRLHANLNHNAEFLFLNHVEIALNFILLYESNWIFKDLF